MVSVSCTVPLWRACAAALSSCGDRETLVCSPAPLTHGTLWVGAWAPRSWEKGHLGLGVAVRAANLRWLCATAKSLTLRSSGQPTASRGLPLNTNVRQTTMRLPFKSFAFRQRCGVARLFVGQRFSQLAALARIRRGPLVLRRSGNMGLFASSSCKTPLASGCFKPFASYRHRGGATNRFGRRFSQLAALACMRRGPHVLRRSGSTELLASTASDAGHASGRCLGAEVGGERSPWFVRHGQSGQLALVACHGEEPNPAFKRTAHGKPWSAA